MYAYIHTYIYVNIYETYSTEKRAKAFINKWNGKYSEKQPKKIDSKQTIILTKETTF